jgi:HD-GYP domain-containing protein (c-di-GMP phosphodiesterase class II)
MEAMVSHRPYRPALGLNVALFEIERASGLLYNPDVAKACISLFRDDRYTIDDKEHEINILL